MQEFELVNLDDKTRVTLTKMLTKEERETVKKFIVYRDGNKIVLQPADFGEMKKFMIEKIQVLELKLNAL